ncbi:MAG: 3-phosphoshikimate 1-carboxyvinyltransferase [Candidatus Limnocylindria bacterium]
MKRVVPAPRLRGRLRLPSDKSIAHRALIANALASGSADVIIRHPGADLRSTVTCLRDVGVRIDEADEADAIRFQLSGQAWAEPDELLDCGNSGTTLRLLVGAIAGRRIGATLDGDESLRRRPMERLAAPLRAMGADVRTTDGRPPVRIRSSGHGGGSLSAMEHRLPVASAQLIGAIALASLSANGTTTVVTTGPTRDHTERLLAWMGVRIRREGTTTTLEGPARPTARSLRVPGDPSSAAAWLVAATLHPDAELELVDVALNPTRLAIVDVLREIGADIEVVPRDEEGPEPVGNLWVRSAGTLRPIGLDGERVAALIDELPLLGVAMAAAEGTSALREAAELRVKESDRIAATVAGLSAAGAHVEELPDGWRIRRGSPRDARIATHGDHRIAIAFAVAGVVGVAASVEVDPASASVSYPTFWADLEAVSRPAPGSVGAA